mmetsp:Transcript_20572/g.30928  ORF Transcript_20572/g.30928 Transcript_20572/m.30928 type:complete len:273 (-) Transcript_20572:304-1122(-)|eukprot:CAMPEP_0178895064 /NCGR_PEP_ID=MMETSP0786-20121207/369_1 /TAXON_ID=186022 /ORGANISM="Thalassionema frauenfeldii, Strain CCMP 1798" /LENGTH=272 /DNA_ID=CAMNT_0020565233 /DNA_START=144 /DNA_END=962 /DNA_ORIENTATION=-
MRIAALIKFLIAILVARQVAAAKNRTSIDDEQESSFHSSTFAAVRAEKKAGLRPIGLSKNLRMEQQSSRTIKSLPQTNLTKVLNQQLTPDMKPKRRHFLHETMHDVTGLLIISGAVAIAVVSSTSSIPVLMSSPTLSAPIPQAAAILLPTLIIPKHLSFLWLEMTNMIQVMMNPFALNYLQNTVVPTALKLSQKFIIMEAWRRIWLHLGKPILDYIFPRSTSNWVEFLPASWVQEIAMFVDTSFQRGIESSFKKSIRTAVDKNIGILFEKFT